MAGLESLNRCTSCEARACGVFRGLQGDSLTELQRHAVPRSYALRQTLLHEGDATPGVYCLQRGSVKVFKTGLEGKQYILRLARPGDLIGAEVVFGDGIATSTAEMLTPGTACFLDRRFLLDAARRWPHVAEEMTRALAAQLRRSDQERVELAQGSVRERLARLLANLARDHGIPDDGGMRIDLKLSREEMAEMVGTAQETAIRLLSEFKRQRMIDLEGRNVVVRQIARLRELANLTN